MIENIKTYEIFFFIIIYSSTAQIYFLNYKVFVDLLLSTYNLESAELFAWKFFFFKQAYYR
jgi:hypothetical protein